MGDSQLADAFRVETGDGWELRLGDCLDPETGLASVGKVDHVITDPPYAKSVYQRFRTNAGGGIRADGRAFSDAGMLKTAAMMAAGRIGDVDDAIVPCSAHFARIAQRWVIVWSDYDSATEWKRAMVDAGLVWKRTDAWTKLDPMPQITGDRPGQGSEVYTAAHTAGKSRWNAGGQSGSHHGPICKGSERPDHPSPKPLWLMERQILDFTDPGDAVCDPFTGSGTTGVAALRNGRRFVGWERDPEFFGISVKRLRATREQMGLFAMGGP